VDEQPGQRPGQQPGRLVPVVDDERIIRGLVSDVLQAEGFRVETAEDGAIAWARLQDGVRPDLILTDQLMPGMDGEAFIRQVHAAGLRMPVILMTALEEAEAPAGLGGADGTLRKPFGLHELLVCVRGVLEAPSPVPPEPITIPSGPSPELPPQTGEYSSLGGTRAERPWWAFWRRG
jgi:two-component system, OmpR family, response regulator MprA